MPLNLSVQIANEAVVYAGERLTVHLSLEQQQDSYSSSRGALMTASFGLDDRIRPGPKRGRTQHLVDSFTNLSVAQSNGSLSAGQSLAASSWQQSQFLSGSLPILQHDEQRNHGTNEASNTAQLTTEHDQQEEVESIVKASAIQQKIQSPKPETAAALSFLSWLFPFGGGSNDNTTERKLEKINESETTSQTHVNVVPLQESTQSSAAEAQRRTSQSSDLSSRPPSTAGWIAAASATTDAEDGISNVGKFRNADNKRPPQFQNLTITMPSNNNNNNNNNKQTRPSLALAFIQTVGYLNVDRSIIKLPAEVEETKRMFSEDIGGASLSDVYKLLSDGKSVPVLITPPEILFGNLDLSSDAPKSFNYEVSLPDYLPPTHRGKALRINYKIIIGVQKTVADKPQLFQIPFRVFHRMDSSGLYAEYPLAHPAVIGHNQCVSYPAASLPSPTQQQLPLSPSGTPSYLDAADFFASVKSPDKNQVSKQQKSLPEKKGVSLQRILNICQQPQKGSFDICKNNVHVAHVHLNKNSCRLGETISAVVDFTESTLACFQMSAYLECCEHVEPMFMSNRYADVDRMTALTVAEWHEMTLNTRRTGFTLCLPHTASPDFQTTAVGVNWQLRLEFTTAVRSSNAGEPSTFTARHQTTQVREVQRSVIDPTVGQPKANNTLLGFAQPSASAEGLEEKGYTELIQLNAPETITVESFQCSLPLRVYCTDWESGQLFQSLHSVQIK